MSEMHDPYEDQLAAARYRAERDQARQELDRLKDRSRDTTMSAYDLLPEEDRDAIAWVREQGGLEEIRKRLMPEGYEWPRYESGEPLRYEDRYVYDGRERDVWHIDFDSYGEPTILNKDGTRSHPDKCERVKRPAPKVLDADGAEIRVGDTVYSAENGTEYEVCEAKLPRVTVEYWCAGISAHSSIVPSLLTHRAPVLAADGKPLREGETVWSVNTGEKLEVVGFDGDYVKCRYDGMDDGIPEHGSWHPHELTHERPDSWERLEEDAGCTATKYNERRGTIFTTKQQVARDLVRRAKALAERERGER